MIAARPASVFEDVFGVLEEKAVEASRPMIECFHAAAKELATGKNWKEAGGEVLCELLSKYLKAYKVQSVPPNNAIDAHKVTNNMYGPKITP